MALRNSQYDVLIRSYNQKQLHNRHVLSKKLEEIYQKIPRIREINEETASLSVRRAKELLSGNENALTSLKLELSELSEEKQILLLRYGYTEQDMELQYECPDCKDTGYIDSQKCHCFKQAAIDMLYTQSNLQEILKAENFDTFTLEYYDNTEVNPVTGKTALINMKEIHHTCLQFTRSFSDTFENLLFYGDTGVGKTFLSNCIARELLDHSFSVIYLTSIQLFDLFSKYTFESADTEQDDLELLSFIVECDLLIIDDLGTELTNTFTNSKLFYTLNERFMRRKSTLISTNLTLDRISQTYSERIFSRLSSNFKILKFYGADIRLKKKLLANRP